MASSTGGGGLGTLGWIAAAGAVSAAVAAGIYYSGALDTDGPAPVETVAKPDVQPSEPAVEPVEGPKGDPVSATAETPKEDAPETTAQDAPVEDPEVVAEDASEEEVEPAPASEPETPKLSAPSFDLVRVEADGTTVIAGTGTSGSTVSVLLDDVAQDTFDVDASGSFVSFLLLPPSDSPRIMTMVAELAGQKVLSEDQIILAPTPKAEPEPEPQVAEATDPAAENEPSSVVEETPAIADATEQAATEAVVQDASETAAQSVAEPAPQDATPEMTVDSETPEASETAVALAETTGTETEELKPEAETPVVAKAPETPEAPEPAAPETELAGVDTQTASGSTDEEATSTSASEPSADQSSEPPIETADAADPVQPAAPAPATPTEPEPEAVAESNPTPEPEPASSSVAVLRAGADGVELIQSGSAPQPEALTDIVLETISYSDEGEVQLTGRAGKRSTVRVYLNNKPLTDLGAGDDGKWKGELNGVEPGIYTLRLDELDAQGDVISRLETPFKREAPEVLVPAESQDPGAAPPIRAITVQKGDTLWAISRARYGDGFLYVKVFDANRDSIRNPDLIYPGQVFSIPD